MEEPHLQMYGNTANVAQGDVKVEQQHIDMKKEHNAQHQTLIYLNQPSATPTEDSARYMRRCHPQGFDDGPEIIYDRRYRGYVLAEESQLLTSQIHASWQKSSSVVNDLHSSVDKFYREVLKRGKERGENILPLHKTFDDAVIWFDYALTNANRASSNIRIRSRVTTALANLKQYIPSFFKWLRTLSDRIGQKGCASLCYPFGCLVLTVTDGIQIDSSILTSLVDITQHFSHSVDYLDLCESRGLDRSLHEATVGLFESVTLLLKTLLEHAWRANKLTKQQEKENIEWLLKLKLSLEDMNVQARVVSDPSRRDQPPFNHHADIRLNLLWSWDKFFNSTRSARRRSSNGSSIYEKAKKHESGPSPATLVDELGYDRKLTEAAIQEFSTPGYLEEAQLSQLAALTRREEFRKWLRAERKATGLLIHGNFEDSFEISPLTYLCANFPLVYGEDGRENIIFLHYFCRGQRHPRRRYQINAIDILKSFIGQLLTDKGLAPRFDLGFVDKRYLRRVRGDDFEGLCKLFVRLLLQLARIKVIVFCFIDSISDIEMRALHKDTERLLSTLQAREWENVPGSRMLFKLLVTDAKATRYAHRYFKPSETINMEGDDEDHNDDYELDLG